MSEDGVQSGSAPATPFAQRNPMALAVLIALRRQAMSPNQVRALLRDRNKRMRLQLNLRSLHAVIALLRKQGLIVPLEAAGEGQQQPQGRSTVYRVTRGGKVEARAWLIDLLSTSVNEYPAFGAALSYLTVLPPDQVVTLLRERVQRLELALAQVQAVRRFRETVGIPRVLLLDNELSTKRDETELFFVSRLQADIESGSLEGVHDWWAHHRDIEPLSSSLLPVGTSRKAKRETAR